MPSQNTSGWYLGELSRAVGVGEKGPLGGGRLVMTSWINVTTQEHPTLSCPLSSFSHFQIFHYLKNKPFYSPYGKKRDSADHQIKMTYHHDEQEHGWQPGRC